MADTIAPAKPGKKQKYDKWEVESAANTLIEAEKIKNNKPLLKLARAELSLIAKAANEAVKGAAKK